MSVSETRIPQEVVERRGHNTPARQQRRVLTASALRQLMDHERARSDRSGLPFALVVFQDRESSIEGLKTIARHLTLRLRAIDEMGHLTSASLGAVLPYCSADDAWRVADDTISAYPNDLLPPTCEVYVYPSKWPAPELDDSADDDLSGNRSIKQLETLFAQPIPWWKRLIDIIGAAIGLVLLAPLLLVVAVAVKLTSRGPILFTQLRTGLGGRRFRMLKFRTMLSNAEQLREAFLAQNEQDGPAFKITNDPRVTRVGRILRIKSIDELPQLWNVLKGEMTLVGPRPLPCMEAEACQQWQRRRHDITPGLTCLWQVRGRSRQSFSDWMRLDLAYVRERSFWLDMKILLLTLPVVFLNRTDR